MSDPLVVAVQEMVRKVKAAQDQRNVLMGQRSEKMAQMQAILAKNGAGSPEELLTMYEKSRAWGEEFIRTGNEFVEAMNSVQRTLDAQMSQLEAK